MKASNWPSLGLCKGRSKKSERVYIARLRRFDFFGEPQRPLSRDMIQVNTGNLIRCWNAG